MKWTLSAVLLITSNVFALSSSDPFKEMNFHKLENGLEVVLAPNESSKNVRIKLVVGYGRWAEVHSSLQAGHVLEHMLFKDGRIEDDKSYLELIQEAGGDVNAYVTNDHTAYHTTIGADKAEWVIEKFRTMLFNRKLEHKELELAMSSVELEIGKPFAISKWLGFSPLAAISENYFPEKSFSETEWGTKRFPYSRENEKLNVRKLSLDQVSQVYRDYYYPSNMTLFISGKFNPETIKKLVLKKFSDIPRKAGMKFLPITAVKRTGDYHKSVYGIEDSGHVTLGKKLFNRTAEELIVTHAYYDYLAHRLMIELRNKKGETYTAYGSINYENKGGTSSVSFTTSSERYEQNKKYVNDLIQNEAVNGKFSDKMIKEAISLFLKSKYEITDNDAKGLMFLADIYHEFRTDFNEQRTPYEILSTMTPDQFRKNLQLVFNQEGDFIHETRPPLFFKFDFVAFFILSIMGSVIFFRSLWKNKAEIGSVIWKYKSPSSPAHLFEVTVLFFGSLIVSYILQRPYEWLIEDTHLIRSTPLISYYADSAVSSLILIGLFMKAMSSLISSVNFTGKDVVIHHFILRETIIPLDEIMKIELKTGTDKLTNAIAVKHGILNAMFDYFFYRPSLFLKLKDGRSFLIHLKNAEEVRQKILSEIEKSAVPELPALPKDDAA